MPCQSPRIRIAEVASLELFYFLPDWRRRRRRNPDVTDGFGFDQLLRARRRRHLQPTQNSGTDVGVVDDDVVSSVGIPGVGIRVEEKRHRRRRQDPRRPKRHLQQRQLRVAEALDGVGFDNDVDQLVQLHVDDVTAALGRAEVVHLVVDLQVPDAAGISGVHLQEVIGVPEVTGAAEDDRLGERDPGK